MPWRVYLLGVFLAAAVTAVSGAGAAVSSEPFAGSVLVTGGPGYGIYAIDAAGGPLKQLVPGPVASEAAWSPDGRQLAFIRKSLPGSKNDRNVPGTLEVMAADGSGPRQVAQLPDTALSTILWSPDSRRIAYGYGGADPASGIHLVGADGRGDRLLVRQGSASRASWSPDGTKLAFIRDVGDRNEAVLFTVDTRPPRAHHTPHVARITHGISVFSTPSWSPDGRRIAFYPCCLQGYDILDLATRKIHRFQPGGGDGVATPLWSPDGKWLALADGGLSLVRPDGRDLHAVPGVVGGVVDAIWSPDSRELAYGDLGTGEVWVTSVDGSTRRQLTHASQYGYSDWNQGWQPKGLTTDQLAGATVPPEPPTDSVIEGLTLRTTKPITRIAAAGDAVAIQYPPPAGAAPGFFDGPFPASCTEVWDVGTGTITRFQGPANCTTNALTDHYHASFDGDRLVWAGGPSHTGGTDNWSVRTATLESPTWFFIPVDGNNAAYGPVSDVVSDDGLDVFETWASACNTLLPGCNPPPQPKHKGRLFRIDGTTATLIASSDGALTPLSVDTGRIVVDRENGRLDIDRRDGSTLSSITLGPPFASADDAYPLLQGCLSGNDVVVLADGSLGHYSAATGAQFGLPVPREGTLDGCANGIVATASETSITLTRLSDDGTATIDTGGSAVGEPGPTVPGTTLSVPAELDRAGLFYAWNTNDTAYPGRVRFIPTAELPTLHR